MTSMFASYNKNNRQGTLLGNWVEEQALGDATGFSRRKVPASTFEPDHRASLWESTHDRTIRHSPESDDEATLETTNRALLCKGVDPKSLLPSSGPRTTLQDADLMARAKEICADERARQRLAEERALAQAMGSTLKADYQAPPVSATLETTRVPRGRNGARIVDRNLLDWTHGQVDRMDQQQLERVQQSAGANYAQGVAVTRYSHAIARGVGLDFAMSASNSAQPFARSSAFSNEIRDPTKRHGEATEPGCEHDERPDMTVWQRSALRRLAEICAADPTWQTELLRAVQQRAVGGEMIELAAFREALGEVATRTIPTTSTSTSTSTMLTDKEAVHIFMYLDLDNVGVIRVAQIGECLRQQMQQMQTQRRTTTPQ